MRPILPLIPARVPDRIIQSAWLEHAPFAHWIVDATRPRLIVELGTYNGYSFCCFCEQIAASGLACRAIAVDTWQGDEHAGTYDDSIYENLSTYVTARYPTIAELKRMYFSEALSSVADGSVDLLHVDGRHFYEDVVEDFTSWIPKLSDRAVVLFHDTQVRERGFGVYKYWAELAGQYPSFEFEHCNGLGVLGFGKNIPAEVQRLFDETNHPDTAAATRRAFAAQGRKIQYRFRARWAVTQGPKALRRKIVYALRGRRTEG